MWKLGACQRSVSWETGAASLPLTYFRGGRRKWPGVAHLFVWAGIKSFSATARGRDADVEVGSMSKHGSVCWETGAVFDHLPLSRERGYRYHTSVQVLRAGDQVGEDGQLRDEHGDKGRIDAMDKWQVLDKNLDAKQVDMGSLLKTEEEGHVTLLLFLGGRSPPFWS